MNRSVLRRDGFLDAALLVTTIGVLLVNGLGLTAGMTAVLPHLLYIPVVIGAYRFPRWGTAAAGSIGGVYLLMVLLTAGGSPDLLVEALSVLDALGAASQ